MPSGDSDGTEFGRGVLNGKGLNGTLKTGLGLETGKASLGRFSFAKDKCRPAKKFSRNVKAKIEYSFFIAGRFCVLDLCLRQN